LRLVISYSPSNRDVVLGDFDLTEEALQEAFRATIAAAHATTSSVGTTDWQHIVRLYDNSA
jgi:predicted RNA polymerase sigma factor